MAFFESPRFPDDISYGSSGGPKWDTSIVFLDSGYEKRNQNWSDARHEYDVSYSVKTLTQLKALADYFNMAKGRANSFRFKDWADYSVTDELLTITGAPTTPLIKTYGSTPNEWIREITKPVVGSFTFEIESVATTLVVNTSTGIVEAPLIVASAGIRWITQSTSALVSTTLTHTLSNGDSVWLSSLTGMTELNDTIVVVASVVGSKSFTIETDTTAYASFVSNLGLYSKWLQPSASTTWSGEFDVPVRFDTDTLSIQLSDYELGDTEVPLIEIRP